MGERATVAVGVSEGEGVALGAGRVQVGEEVDSVSGATVELAAVAVILSGKGVELALTRMAGVALGRSVGGVVGTGDCRASTTGVGAGCSVAE